MNDRSSPLNGNEIVRPRVPAWVVPVGCLSVFVCLVLCGTAVGVWVYVLRNGYVFGNNPDSAVPPTTPPPNWGNFPQPPEGEVVNGRFVEAEGGFSYVPPEGWMAYRIPGLKYRIVSGPMKIGDAPNINAADETFAGSLEDYVRANLANLQALMEDFRLLKQEKFRTAEGLSGVRVIAEVKQMGRNHRQTYYFFGKGNTKYIVVCTTNSEGGEKLDPVFEASMKTFRIERK